jgi:hypothetical protein
VQPQNSGTASTPLNKHRLPGRPSFKDKVWSADLSKCSRRSLEQRALRSTDTVFLVVPRSRTKYGQRTFQSAAAEVWNRLPKNIRNEDTVSSRGFIIQENTQKLYSLKNTFSVKYLWVGHMGLKSVLTSLVNVCMYVCACISNKLWLCGRNKIKIVKKAKIGFIWKCFAIPAQQLKLQ